jgi:deoxycytidine triphosphate deaminase
MTATDPDRFELGQPYGWSAPDDVDDLPRSYWLDPIEGVVGGVLGGDEIRLYCSMFGMIRKYDEQYLRRAAYTLTVGERARVAGNSVQVRNGEPLRIAARGSATVVPAEVLVVPHYLVAHFGLTVGLAQQGLLLGAGPQVDPGYQGALSCPVHNLTDGDIELELGRRFLHVELVRTAPLASEARERLIEIETEHDLYAVQAELMGADDQPTPLFARERRWRDPLQGY